MCPIWAYAGVLKWQFICHCRCGDDLAKLITMSVLLHNQSMEPMGLNTVTVILSIRLIVLKLFHRIAVVFEYLLSLAVSPGTLETGATMTHGFGDD